MVETIAEEEQPRALNERPRDQHTPALSSRQIADRSAGDGGEAKAFKRFRDDAPIG